MERISLAIFLLISGVAVSLGFPDVAYSQWPAECEESSLPSHDPKYPANQLKNLKYRCDWIAMI